MKTKCFPVTIGDLFKLQAALKRGDILLTQHGVEEVKKKIEDAGGILDEATCSSWFFRPEEE